MERVVEFRHREGGSARSAIFLSVLIIAIAFWVLGFGGEAGSTALEEKPISQASGEKRGAREPGQSGALPRGAMQLDSIGSEMKRRVIAAPPDSSYPPSAQEPSPTSINVGVYIDPEELPPSPESGLNIGSYIDPEALPQYSTSAVNVGSFIDPEELPQGSAVRINYGVYMDPDAPRVDAIGSLNVGPALPGSLP